MLIESLSGQHRRVGVESGYGRFEIHGSHCRISKRRIRFHSRFKFVHDALPDCFEPRGLHAGLNGCALFTHDHLKIQLKGFRPKPKDVIAEFLGWLTRLQSTLDNQLGVTR